MEKQEQNVKTGGDAYLIMIIKQTLIGTETLLKSSFVLSEVDDDESSGFIWLSGVFVLDVDDSDVTKTLSSELKSSCPKK